MHRVHKLCRLMEDLFERTLAERVGVTVNVENIGGAVVSIYPPARPQLTTEQTLKVCLVSSDVFTTEPLFLSRSKVEKTNVELAFLSN